VDPTAKLEYDDIRARAISRADNDDDAQGMKCQHRAYPADPRRQLADRAGQRRLRLRR
jgi:hypothetical protein